VRRKSCSASDTRSSPDCKCLDLIEGGGCVTCPYALCAVLCCAVLCSHATYKDQHRLFFLLELSLGGELFTVLRARQYFDEPTARFYAATVVLAFEYMHSKDSTFVHSFCLFATLHTPCPALPLLIACCVVLVCGGSYLP
jgi:hypothetical protein